MYWVLYTFKLMNSSWVPKIRGNFIFCTRILSFFRPVALLWSLKKPSFRHKILNFRLNLTTQDEFNIGPKPIHLELIQLFLLFYLIAIAFHKGSILCH